MSSRLSDRRTGVDTTPAAPAAERVRRVPAEEGFWVLIFGDLVIFSAFFATYLYYRGRQPELFAHAQAQLSRGFGLANTILLLTGSLLVSIGVRSIRANTPRVSQRALGGALLCAVGFVGLKGAEWGLKFTHGISPATNNFYTYYFILTGLHLVHVLMGIAALCFLLVQARRSELTPKNLVYVEAAACFWHLVDLLWIVLFPLLYLVR
jgi:nitric oxide reductase NorE protein